MWGMFRISQVLILCMFSFGFLFFSINYLFAQSNGIADTAPSSRQLSTSTLDIPLLVTLPEGEGKPGPDNPDNRQRDPSLNDTDIGSDPRGDQGTSDTDTLGSSDNTGTQDTTDNTGTQDTTDTTNKLALRIRQIKLAPRIRRLMKVLIRKIIEIEFP